jgi:hypothetical protein
VLLEYGGVLCCTVVPVLLSAKDSTVPVKSVHACSDCRSPPVHIPTLSALIYAAHPSTAARPQATLPYGKGAQVAMLLASAYAKKAWHTDCMGAGGWSCGSVQCSPTSARVV